MSAMRCQGWVWPEMQEEPVEAEAIPLEVLPEQMPPTGPTFLLTGQTRDVTEIVYCMIDLEAIAATNVRIW